MSKISSEAKMLSHTKRFGNKRKVTKPVDRSYTNFAGSNVPPATKESWDKAMALAHKYKNMTAW